MTKIEWTDVTWNPVTGCNKVSQGCKNCYAEKMHKRLMHIAPHKYTKPFLSGPEIHESELLKPFSWKTPRRVFVNSMSDLFHKDVPFEFIAKVFAVMALNPQHTFQILTKRPDVAIEYFKKYQYWGLPDSDSEVDNLVFNLMYENEHLLYEKRGRKLSEILTQAGWIMNVTHDSEYLSATELMYESDGPLKNVWIGVSCEDQATADERIPLLIQIPAHVRFLSCEPLIGSVNICQSITIYQFQNSGSFHSTWFGDKIQWVITGGESGYSARPVHPDWIRALRDQCKTASVPFFFKQWGEWSPDHVSSQQTHAVNVDDNGTLMYKTGKSNSGNLLDGVQHLNFPA